MSHATRRPRSSDGSGAAEEPSSAAANRLSTLMAKAVRAAPQDGAPGTSVGSSSQSVHSHASHTGSLRVVSPSTAAPSIAAPQTSNAQATLLPANDAVWRSSAAKRAEKAWAIQSEKALANDAKFKKYQSSMERTLATFDSVSEWADFISFLTRLQKVLSAQGSFNVIPRKLVVAKRLSQCLNPALPSGVHQKALEVYEQVLSAIGREGLRRDLHVWSPGLFPFFAFASTSVKPNLLAIFDKYYLALGEDLRPVAKALLLALLPGLEEESGEFFDRVLRLLDHVSSSISGSFFLQNVWLVIITAQPVRLAAFNYLHRRLPKLDKLQGTEATGVVGQDLGLMVRAFTAALRDEALLVRRLALDLLVTHLPVCSHTFSHVVKPDDAVMLVGAAIGVVLRRDLSLNRRLYSWLLGPEEQDQNAYLLKHSLDFVRLSLIQGLARTSTADDGADPYRVFISLLDKWEIGQPLSNVIILDIFSALHKAHLSDGAAAAEQGSTAKMLFEVVDPFAMYRQFYFALKHELDPAANAANQVAASSRTVEVEQDSAVKLLSFVLRSFPVHDEETRQVHLPALFSGLVHLVAQLAQKERVPPAIDIPQALSLAEQILALIPPKVFVRVAKAEQPADASNLAARGDFGQQVELFYAPRDPVAGEASKLVLSFQRADVVLALLELAAALSERTMADDRLARVRPPAARLLRSILGTLHASEEDGLEAQPKVVWDARAWSQTALRVLAAATEPEDMHALASCVVACATCRALAKPLQLHDRGAVDTLVGRALALLARDMVAFHARGAELVTALDALAPQSLVQAALCGRLLQQDWKARLAAADAIGTLWRVLDEGDVDVAFLDQPLALVLEGLQSRHAAERQAAEAWLRNYVKSFVRIVTPYLRRMLQVPLTLRPSSQQVAGIEVSGFLYEQPFDCHTLAASVLSLSSVLKEGGLSCLRTLRATKVRGCRDAVLVQAAAQIGFDLEQSVLDLIVTLAARFLRSGCPEQYRAAMGMAVSTLQAEAADLVQFVASRQQLDAALAAELRDVVLQRTAKAIADRDLLGQNRLLHALHALLHERPSEETDKTWHSSLLQLLRAGLAMECNRPALHQWADFSFSILPLVRRNVADFLVPLAECVCQLFKGELAELDAARLYGKRTDISDGELVTLVNLAERICHLCLEEGTAAEPPTPATVSHRDSSAGLLGYVTGARTAAAESPDPSESTVDGMLQRFVGELQAAWRLCSASAEPAIAAIFAKTKARCKRALERLYRQRAVDVVMALLAGAQGSHPGKLSHQDTLFEILDVLVPSEQIAVTYVCDAIGSRLDAASGKKRARHPHVLDDSLYALLCAYMDRVDGARAAQIWPVLNVLAKDVAQVSTPPSAALYGVLQSLSAAGAKLSTAKVFEDKRVRREVQDVFVKVLDLAILAAGRAPEASYFGRRTARDADDAGSPPPAEPHASLADLSDAALAAQLVQQMADAAFPTLRQLALDADRLQAVCTNAMYYVVGPALKTKARNFDVNLTTLGLLGQICHMPQSVKTWRAQVADAFHDARFFQAPDAAVGLWKSIVLSLYSLDKERLAEAIARVGPSSANIFTSREAEARQRAAHLRRLSFILYSAETDFWLPQFPAMQERIVELLKSAVPEVVEVELWRCLRIVLCRFSPQHVSSMWPVIISEMVESFERLAEGPAALSRERVRVLGGVAKFLDMLLTLQAPDFQVHQWLFVADTTDVVYPPNDWVSEALVDRITQALAEKRPDSPAKDARRRAAAPVESSALRRPMLGPGTVESLDELDDFFRHVSIGAYESVYAAHGVDHKYVEQLLQDDLFDEREQ